MHQPLERVAEMADKLIAQGRSLRRVRVGTSKMYFVEDLEPLWKWATQIRTLNHLLGKGNPWEKDLKKDLHGHWNDCEKMFGVLTGVADAVRNGHLQSLEDWVFQEAFGNLLDQADYLCSKKHHVAAAVLGRAVLEEHLRNWCSRLKCAPKTRHPGISDYNTALYTLKHMLKNDMFHVQTMAAIGNTATHEGKATKDEAERLLRDVREFIRAHPLPT